MLVVYPTLPVCVEVHSQPSVWLLCQPQATRDDESFFQPTAPPLRGNFHTLLCIRRLSAVCRAKPHVGHVGKQVSGGVAGGAVFPGPETSWFESLDFCIPSGKHCTHVCMLTH